MRRPKKFVTAQRLRELFHATVNVRRPPRIADLTAAGATRFGLNAEIHATLDYSKPTAWAVSLREAGHRGLRHLLRGDVTLEAAGTALFGSAGLHARAPAGMQTSVTPLDVQAATTLLAARGVLVVPIPRDVRTIRPPAR